MFTTLARNTMLTNISGGSGFVALANTFPDQGFTGELTGGAPAYARKVVTYAAAASGQILTSNSPLFDVPAAGIVQWIIFATAVTAGNSNGTAPNGAQPKKYGGSAVVANGIAAPLHGYALNQQIVFYSGTPMTGLTNGVIYFVTNPLTDTFTVAATASGSTIIISGQPSSDSLLSRIVVETFAAQGTFTLNAGAILSLNF